MHGIINKRATAAVVVTLWVGVGGDKGGGTWAEEKGRVQQREATYAPND